MQVDPGDEPRPGAGPDRDVRAELEARAVVDGGVAVGVAVSRELGDVGPPRQPERRRGLRERRAEAGRVGVERPQPVEALERVEDVGRAAERAVGRRLERRAREREEPEALGRTLDGFEHGRGRLFGTPAARLVLRARATRLRQRRAQARDRLAVALGGLAQLLDLAQQVLAVGADRPQLPEPLLGARGARLGARDLGLEARGPARLLVALGLGRLAAPARGLGLAAQVLDARELLLEPALPRLHVALPAVGVAHLREQRRVRHLGGRQEALPRAEHLDHDVRVGPVLGLQPVLRAGRLADEDDPAVEVREVVGLLDEERDLAQARVRLRPPRTARRGGTAAGRARRRAVAGRRVAVLLALPAPLALLRPPPFAAYAASAPAGASRGRRRETTFETPSSPIDTPYRGSAASIVRFWWVTTMNCARSA